MGMSGRSPSSFASLRNSKLQGVKGFAKAPGAYREAARRVVPTPGAVRGPQWMDGECTGQAMGSCVLRILFSL